MIISDYEDAIIAALFSDEQEDCLPILSATLPAERFGSHEKQLIYEAALRVWGNPQIKRITPLNVAANLGENLKDAGGQEGIN